MPTPPVPFPQDIERQPGQTDWWSQLWSKNIAPWHSPTGSTALQTYLHLLPPPTSESQSRRTRFLLPLCGKAVDLLYLYQQGFHVVGIDVAEEAIKQFFVDNRDALQQAAQKHSPQHQVSAGAVPSVSPVVEPSASSSGIKRYRYPADYSDDSHSPCIDLYVSDWFDPTLTADVIGGTCDAGFDRGALIALPSSIQQQYVEKLMQLLPQTHSGTTPHNYLLLAVEKMSGQPPPHNTDTETIHRYFKPYVKQQNTAEIKELSKTTNPTGSDNIVYGLKLANTGR